MSGEVATFDTYQKVLGAMRASRFRHVAHRWRCERQLYGNGHVETRGIPRKMRERTGKLHALWKDVRDV